MTRAAGDDPFYTYELTLIRKNEDGTTTREKPREVRFPSVTTKLKILDKPAIPGWYWKVTTDGVSELLKDEDLKMVGWSGQDVRDELKARALRPYDFRDVGGAKGTDAHDALERIFGGEFKAAELIKDESPWVRSVAQWVFATSPKMLAYEFPVVSIRWGFAGQLDFVWWDADGKLKLTDLKTSKRVYAETPLQLNGYAIAWNEMNPKHPIQRLSTLLAYGNGDPAEEFDAELDPLSVLSVFAAESALVMSGFEKR